jgi:hypothetical protein
MKETFPSIRACLDGLEFCPLCSKRTSVELYLGLGQNDSYFTRLNNDSLRVVWLSNHDDAFVIDLNGNRVISSNIIDRASPVIDFKCKTHFAFSYELLGNDEIRMKAHYLRFNLSDKKYKVQYWISSAYETGKTSIGICKEMCEIDRFTQPLIPFREFDPKKIVKQVRMLNLLRQ